MSNANPTSPILATIRDRDESAVHPLASELNKALSAHFGRKIELDESGCFDHISRWNDRKDTDLFLKVYLTLRSAQNKQFLVRYKHDEDPIDYVNLNFD
jgi:hypothetical protein